jgi:hypothetical protein
VNEPAVERRYPYWFGTVDLGCLTLALPWFGVLAVFSVILAIRDSGPVRYRFIHLEGGYATLFKWVAALSCLGVTLAGLVHVVRALRARKGSIAFTRSGVHLPRSRYAREQEFVNYQDINYLTLEKNFLCFDCSKGRFSIARQKLSKQHFSEITNLLRERVRIATGRDWPCDG